MEAVFYDRQGCSTGHNAVVLACGTRVQHWRLVALLFARGGKARSEFIPQPAGSSTDPAGCGDKLLSLDTLSGLGDEPLSDGKQTPQPRADKQ
jgi:hypothetical protein